MDVQVALSSRSQDTLMLSGEESKWRLLKEALPRLEALKEKSGILFLDGPLQSLTHHPLCAVLWAEV